ncbi:MAG TPA: hypothetical protein VM598_09100 [Bdellovibrionota bacterium]|nr:hypothetical protein [Bdellovibrionota bacterium]
MRIGPVMAAALLACTFAVQARAAAPADPCETTLAEIAAGLESGKVDEVVKHLVRSRRTTQAIEAAILDGAAAEKLAVAFRTAKLKSTFDNKRIYAATGLEIGATVGLAGCVVQAW